MSRSSNLVVAEEIVIFMVFKFEQVRKLQEEVPSCISLMYLP